MNKKVIVYWQIQSLLENKNNKKQKALDYFLMIVIIFSESTSKSFRTEISNSFKLNFGIIFIIRDSKISCSILYIIEIT